MTTAIRTTGLTKRYFNQIAVNDVNIDIPQGEIVGLVGKNGAGKTTLIRLLTGLVFPTSGTFELLPDASRTDTDVAAVVERPASYKSMTAADNMIAQCLLLGLQPDPDYIERTLQLVGLSSADKKLVKNYSLGMQQRLAIALTLIGKPKLLFLDEPTNGLDPQGIHDIREILVSLNRQMGVTIVVSSHILSELAKFATMFLFMDNGRIVKSVRADELSELSVKHTRITVDNTDLACELLAPLGKTKVFAEHVVDFAGDVPPTTLLLALAQGGVTATNLFNANDGLEEYFLQLTNNANAPQNPTLSDALARSTAASGTNPPSTDNNRKGDDHD